MSLGGAASGKDDNDIDPSPPQYSSFHSISRKYAILLAQRLAGGVEAGGRRLTGSAVLAHLPSWIHTLQNLAAKVPTFCLMGTPVPRYFHVPPPCERERMRGE